MELMDIYLFANDSHLVHVYGWGDRVCNNEEDEEDYIDRVGDGDDDDKHPSRGERDCVRSYNKLTEKMICKGTPERKTSFPNGEVDLKPGIKVEYKYYTLGYKTSMVRKIIIKDRDKLTSDWDACCYDDDENKEKLITMYKADGTKHTNEDHRR
eukprot:scaffold19773_cov43-Cyclotella_meneghiniana.AAC.7